MKGETAIGRAVFALAAGIALIPAIANAASAAPVTGNNPVTIASPLPAGQPGLPSGWRTNFTRVAAESPAGSDEVGLLAYDAYRYGYRGTFRDGTAILDVDWWFSGRLESFGISPYRTIWHAWPGSGAWREMPHGGLADHVNAAYFSSTSRIRVIEVFVTSNNTFWCSQEPGDGTGWSPWFNCT
jgi:hypothetical protein